MLNSLNLAEISGNGDGKFKVRLEYHNSSIERDVVDPQKLTERMQWLFDVYPFQSPYEGGKAESIAAEIDEYGQSLLEQIQLLGFVSSYVPDDELDLVALDIYGSAAFHSLRWESLEKSYHANRDKSMPRVLVRRKVSTSLEEVEAKQRLSPHHGLVRTSFNILLVVSRPDKGNDIDPLISSSAITDILRLSEPKRSGLPSQIHLEIARPGTWAAFEEHLKASTERWWREGGSGPWFDIVHFDVHGSIDNGEAYLHFLTRNGKGILAKSATLIGSYLARYKVSFVLSNACDSASLGGAGATCLARTLVESGVNTVIGMSFKLTSSAARILIRAFYFRLLVPGIDGLEALWVIRTALREHAIRAGKFDLALPLNDYIVPVIFVAADAHVNLFDQWAREYKPHEVGVSYNVFRDHCNELNQAAFQHAQEAEKAGSTYSLVGRQQDIMELEWLLLRKPKSSVLKSGGASLFLSRLMLICGVAGVGKTSLASFLGPWWVSTGLIRSFRYWTMSNFLSVHFDDMTFFDAAGNKFELYIVDQMESLTSKYISEGFTVGEKERFMNSIRQLSSPNRYIILISRLEEEWLGLPQQQRYRLGGLGQYESTVLASRIMNELGLGRQLLHKENGSYLQFLIDRLWYNPLSMKVFLGSMKLNGLSGQETNPKLLFNKLLVLPGFIEIRENTHTTIVDIYKFIEFISREASKVDEEQDICEAILSLLCLCSGVCDEEWRGSIYLESFKDPNWMDMCALLSRSLEDSGWIEKFRPSKIESVSFFRIHPLFLNVVREFCYNRYWRQGTKVLELERKFRTRETMKILNLALQPHSELLKKTLVQVEALNYFAVVDGILVSLPGLVPSENFDIHSIQAYLILRTLWDTARKSPSTTIGMDLVLPRMLSLSCLLEEKVDSMSQDSALEGDVLKTLLSLTGRLSEHYMQLDTTRADYTVNITLHYVSHHPEQLREWDDILWLTFARCLIYHGFNCLYQGAISESKIALELAVCVLRFVELNYRNKFDINTVKLPADRPISEGAAALAAILRSMTLKDPNKFDANKIEIRPESSSTQIAAPMEENSGPSVDQPPSEAQEQDDKVEIPRGIYDLAIFRHAALTGLRKVAETTNDGMEETYEDLCNGVAVFLTLVLNTQDIESIFGSRRLSFEQFDIRDISLETLGIKSTIRSFDFIKKARLMLSKGNAESAKRLLFEGIDEAMGYDNPLAESECQQMLANISITNRDWDTAVRPIHRLLQIYDDAEGGPFIGSWPDQRKFDFSGYGMALIRTGDFWGALRCFEFGLTGKSVRVGERTMLKVFLENGNANDMVKFCLYLTRMCLLSLVYLPLLGESIHRKPITPEDFYETDDLMQSLLHGWALEMFPESSDDPTLEESMRRDFSVKETGLENGECTLEFTKEIIRLPEGVILKILGEDAVNAAEIFGSFDGLKKLKNISNFAEEKGLEHGKSLKLVLSINFAGISAMIPVFLNHALDDMPDYTTITRRLNK